ncbi:MAG: DUF4328 domain-containing protein [Rhodospirillaceae bacterium]|nr:DUF4328 domain-containing protein [Rhodospirillaceae bacterium]MYJ70620.1 DUF4328 domain-containing protein [Rhodospirillaceae bacterium]
MAKPARPYRFRPLLRLAGTVIVLMILGMVAALADLVHDINLLGLFNEAVDGDGSAIRALDRAAETALALKYANGAILFVTAVFFLVWVYRAHADVRALGFGELKFTPGWAVGWWFIPFFNLVQPARAMAELYRIAEVRKPSAGRTHIRIRPVLAWWLLLLVSSCATRAGVAGEPADPVEPVRQMFVFWIFGNILYLAAAMLAMWLVRRITDGIESAKAAADRAEREAARGRA